MTILLAGFGSFPGAPINPCEALVRSLEDVATTQRHALSTVVVPVEWDRSWAVLSGAIEASRATSVVLFGLNARAPRLRLEIEAVNARELGREDAAGGFPSGPMIGDGPERLACRLPLGAVARSLRQAGIDFEISRDAGRYLCNDTFYRLCRHGAARGLAHWGFVHVPPTDEVLDDWIAAGALPELCRTLSADDLRRAALALIEVLSPPGA